MLAPADLNFAGQKTAYASHGLHSFSAKFPPQLARWGIEELSTRAEVVLDPMVGSGTTLVEARLRGRHALGADIDPLARLIARVKSTRIDEAELATVSGRVVETVERDFAVLAAARALDTRFERAFPDARIPEFPNRDYWFLPQVSEELALIKSRIDAVDAPAIRDFLYVVFSALIITKSSTSVANVRDLAHSRPHFAPPRRKPDVLHVFRTRLARLSRGIVEFGRGCDPESSATIVGQDARRLPLPDASVDLVFTSPPYVNAIDYPRAHKFSLHWLGDALGVTPEQYRELGREYIGTDRVPIAECMAKAKGARGLVARLADIDPRRAGVTQRYFEDMGAVIGEISRVLRPNRHAVVVVCPSNIAGVAIPTHRLLSEIAEMRGMVHEETLERTLDDSKRQLPLVRGRFGPGMRTEYVIVLRRQAA